jgi:hypothetical protein
MKLGFFNATIVFTGVALAAQLFLGVQFPWQIIFDLLD